MQPDIKKVSELLKLQMVQAWIDAWTKNSIRQERHVNCWGCGWPHDKHILCGAGATFGVARLGNHPYVVDASNVEWTIGLFESLGSFGFHWKNDIFFDKKDDNVIVTYWTPYNNCPNQKQWTIPMLEWKSIVDFIEGKRSAGERVQAAATDAGGQTVEWLDIPPFLRKFPDALPAKSAEVDELIKALRVEANRVRSVHQISGMDLSVWQRVMNEAADLIAALRRERDELQNEIKRLAPEIVIGGMGIHAWKQCAESAERALAEENKLSAAISRDCNATALERNELRDTWRERAFKAEHNLRVSDGQLSTALETGFAEGREAAAKYIDGTNAELADVYAWEIRSLKRETKS